MAIVIEPLAKHHDRASVRCGERELDDWFLHRAGQDERRNLARVFVALNQTLGIVGFYSLSAFTLAIEDLPETVARELPRYDAIPAALIGRLARHERARGQGLGEVLLADAIRRILSAGKSLAVFAILVDAKNAGAAAFYQGFGFRQFPLRPSRLFLLTSSALAAIERM